MTDEVYNCRSDTMLNYMHMGIYEVYRKVPGQGKK
jgi:hypothetical protein